MDSAVRSVFRGLIVGSLAGILLGFPFNNAETPEEDILSLNSVLSLQTPWFVASPQDGLRAPFINETPLGDGIFDFFEAEGSPTLENPLFNPLVLQNNPVHYSNLEAITTDYPASKPYIPMVLESVDRHKDIFYVDPFPFLSLTNAESSFNPDAVSGAGAAGLTQTIPETGEYLGLRIYQGNLHIYYELKAEIGRKNTSYNRILVAINRENGEELERLARQYNQHRKRVNELAQQYRETLLEHKDEDDRFNPALSIDAGVRYFAILARRSMEEKGVADLRGIIAAYNYRGEAAAGEWNLPMVYETINHINRVLDFCVRMWPLVVSEQTMQVVSVGDDKY